MSQATNQPFVSVVMPTYNRRKFLPTAIDCFMAQSYPQDKMEWVILDDGTDCVKDVFDELNAPNVRYYREETKMLIGAKRNRLNDLAKGAIIVSWDDDDYYPPDRVKHAVNKLVANPKIELAGTSEVYMYYTDIKKIYKFGPYNPNHATNGTMAWRRSYSLMHKYDETVTHAEEKSFLDDYKHPMIQLDPFKVMLVMSHSQNTYDKRGLIKTPSPVVTETQLTLKNFIKSAVMRKFFADA